MDTPRIPRAGSSSCAAGYLAGTRENWQTWWGPHESLLFPGFFHFLGVPMIHCLNILNSFNFFLMSMLPGPMISFYSTTAIFFGWMGSNKQPVMEWKIHTIRDKAVVPRLPIPSNLHPCHVICFIIECDRMWSLGVIPTVNFTWQLSIPHSYTCTYLSNYIFIIYNIN